MPTRHKTSDQVWNAILPEIRTVRRHRKIRRIAVIAGCTVLTASWFVSRPSPSPVAPQVTVVAPTPVPVPLAVAVYRVDENGKVWLEELDPQSLGNTELAMGLAPVILSDQLKD